MEILITMITISTMVCPLSALNLLKCSNYARLFHLRGRRDRLPRPELALSQQRLGQHPRPGCCKSELTRQHVPLLPDDGLVPRSFIRERSLRISRQQRRRIILRRRILLLRDQDVGPSHRRRLHGSKGELDASNSGQDVDQLPLAAE